jgi:hypothetical protein
MTDEKFLIPAQGYCLAKGTCPAREDGEGAAELPQGFEILHSVVPTGLVYLLFC